MTENLGAILIWASWAYIAVAVIAARVMINKARRANPTYFRTSQNSSPDPFNFARARDILELIADSSPETKGFDASILRLARVVKAMYLSAPIALILFFMGILIR
ncbi:hypothetical protein J5837_12260 [Pseudoxanthomonas helianthi]|uniref:Uncharacterized protein n=1 Tax=Pseudoxanthomonas helianthi TaxID=1453541 RepID=A0A940X6I5_9GAMM|nr:hypothetical protein [Pseudoxanthomonas helianthi]MBP3985180.1 hypothetical protein [Pseudoxanthomonas helianthi]